MKCKNEVDHHNLPSFFFCNFFLFSSNFKEVDDEKVFLILPQSGIYQDFGNFANKREFFTRTHALLYFLDILPLCRVQIWWRIYSRVQWEAIQIICDILGEGEAKCHINFFLLF